MYILLYLYGCYASGQGPTSTAWQDEKIGGLTGDKKESYITVSRLLDTYSCGDRSKGKCFLAPRLPRKEFYDNYHQLYWIRTFQSLGLSIIYLSDPPYPYVVIDDIGVNKSIMSRWVNHSVSLSNSLSGDIYGGKESTLRLWCTAYFTVRMWLKSAAATSP
jgi:hypothetical protein